MKNPSNRRGRGNTKKASTEEITNPKEIPIWGLQFQKAALTNGKWLRFQKEIDIPDDADTDKISSKLEQGILYVKQPKKPSATSSNIPPSQNERDEPLKPAATEPTVAPPTVGSNAPESQSEPRSWIIIPAPDFRSFRNERADTPKPAATKSTVYPPTVRPNAPKSQNDRPKSQASGKQIPTPPKPEEATGAPARIPKSGETSSMGCGQPVEDLAKKEKTEDKGKIHTKLRDALEKTRRRRRLRRGKKKLEKRSEEMGEESGRLRRREGYKQVVDGVVKELRTNMVTLALGVILYLNLSKKGHTEEEL
uniref:SHSP domain-containing protein n=1 Tax=Cucumis sativus TaxID=3659 RepID=A0A0A0LZR6_CUCSA